MPISFPKNCFYKSVLSVLWVVLCFGHAKTVSAQTFFPPNIYGDTLHAPFYHGVASGDPLSDRVILWTRITPPNSGTFELFTDWQMATDTTFNTIISSGTAITSEDVDWTVKVDAGGLLPHTKYYYRFVLPNGNTSAIGQTQTTSVGNQERLRLGVGSCSSIFSGYFNAYRRIAEETNLDAFIHLGDYIYDFVDAEEEVRVPQPYPEVPQNLAEWRARHSYYLLDPDLRAARQRLPWIVIWDNHDIEHDDPLDISGSKQAFWEYLPIRMPDITSSNLIYRSIRFGNLVHLLMLDVLCHRGESEIQPGVPSMMGNTQYDWLTDELTNSDAVWRVIGSSKMVGTWSIEGLPPLGFGDGDVADLNAWDGFTEERLRVLHLLADNNLSNNIFISGDSHISMLMDLPFDPMDSLQYDKHTGEGSVAVEMLPTSISRGNFDESGIPPTFINIISNLFRNLNPHEVYNELTQHGYGVLDISADSTVAEIKYNPISTDSDQQNIGVRMVTYANENHWRRQNTVSIEPDPSSMPPNMTIYPNPAKNTLVVKFLEPPTLNETVHLTNLEGKTVLSAPIKNLLTQNQLQFDVSKLQKGIYIVSFMGKGILFSKE